MKPSNMWPKDVIHAYHLRARSVSGTKDWVCLISSHPFHSKHLWVIFGKTADVMSGGGQGRALTNSVATEEALKNEVRKKVNSKDKYEIVDEFEAHCGWHSQPSSRSAVPPQPPKETKAAKLPTPPAAKAPPKSHEQEDYDEPTMCW